MATYRAKPPKGALLNRADPLAKGLAGAWLFSEGAGLSVRDSAGSNHGTLTNGPTWGSGPYGKLLTFDASNDYISIPARTELLPTTAVTFAAIVRLNAAVDFRCIAAAMTSYGNYGWNFMVSSTGFLRWEVDTTGGIVTLNGTTSIVGSHALVAGTYDGANTRVYRDGKQENSSALTGTIDYGSPPTFVIGVRFPSEALYYWNGTQTAAWLWNRALTARDMRDLAADPFRMFRRRQVLAPAAAPAGGNRRRRIICGASA